MGWSYVEPCAKNPTSTFPYFGKFHHSHPHPSVSSLWIRITFFCQPLLVLALTCINQNIIWTTCLCSSKIAAAKGKRWGCSFKKQGNTSTASAAVSRKHKACNTTQNLMLRWTHSNGNLLKNMSSHLMQWTGEPILSAFILQFVTYSAMPQKD